MLSSFTAIAPSVVGNNRHAHRRSGFNPRRLAVELISKFDQPRYGWISIAQFPGDLTDSIRSFPQFRRCFGMFYHSVGLLQGPRQQTDIVGATSIH